jgi:hypothetical protein
LAVRPIINKASVSKSETDAFLSILFVLPYEGVFKYALLTCSNSVLRQILLLSLRTCFDFAKQELSLRLCEPAWLSNPEAQSPDWLHLPPRVSALTPVNAGSLPPPPRQAATRFRSSPPAAVGSLRTASRVASGRDAEMWSVGSRQYHRPVFFRMPQACAQLSTDTCFLPFFEREPEQIIFR